MRVLMTWQVIRFSVPAQNFTLRGFFRHEQMKVPTDDLERGTNLQ